MYRDAAGNVLDENGNVIYPAGSAQATAFYQQTPFVKPPADVAPGGMIPGKFVLPDGRIGGYTADAMGNPVPYYASGGADWQHPLTGAAPAAPAPAQTTQPKGVTPVSWPGGTHHVTIGGVQYPVTDRGSNSSEGWRSVSVGSYGGAYFDGASIRDPSSGAVLGVLAEGPPTTDTGGAGGTGGGAGTGGSGDGTTTAAPGFDVRALLTNPIVLGGGALLLASQAGLFNARRRR